jgi:hypothetical protein
LLALGWWGSIGSLSACRGSTTSISGRNFEGKTSSVWSDSWPWSVRRPKSRAACRPSPLSQPAITGPSLRRSAWFSRVNVMMYRSELI